MALHRALSKLQTVVSFMNSGAHPDDENSTMLAALGVRDGIDLSYVCSTRGEGGQNDIGTQSGAALGVLRTAEMERAAQVLDMALYWLSEDPDDPITDFGFSKSGTDTMARWGEERTMRRFVEVVRTERPDILCPTFLDVPGQHGHHRAMTAAAHEVMTLAADPAFDTGQAPWQISKLYLPAMSGAGHAYDDDLPPPPTTLTIESAGRDPLTGFSYAQIGQQSRAFHRTQAMGHWQPPGAGRDTPLHLAQSFVSGPDNQIGAGLPQTLADLDLGPAQAHFDAARGAFPDFETVLAELAAGLALLQAARPAPEHAHKIARKITQAATAMRLAAGVEVHATLGRDVLGQGEVTDVTLASCGDIEPVLTVETGDGWESDGTTLRASSAAPSDPMPHTYLPDRPAAPRVAVSLTAHGVTSTTHHPFEVPLLVAPERRAALAPGRDVVNLQSTRREVEIALGQIAPEGAKPSIELPDGWISAETETGFRITLPDDIAPGAYTLPLTLDGAPAVTWEHITAPHTAPRALSTPAELRVDVIDCALPQAKIGYIGGGNDNACHWLRRAGFNITEIDDAALGSDAALAKFDSLLVGIFAVKFRAGLAEAMPRLHHWTENGGTLVTLYHRPWDNWDPDTIPPKRLEIGMPSLRWRVTDENADVTHLAQHAALSQPNLIGPGNWEGWHKERGLYFAKSWDAAYTPLLRMADPDEEPHDGALLVADIGKGRHVHCALILHHQMAQGVQGAYRLMANLLAPRD
ncbi:PIG-L family deacetylase [Pseudaestuariivita sp.]|uniref:PIG-L family deacetylase n=1 Tax=Pseudaestuariivita sp. TaxID=2211669 RepID=UPI004059B926